MRQYYKLDTVSHDPATDTLLFTASTPDCAGVSLWFGREGIYLSVSASYGPFEVALRPRLRDLKASLRQIKPTERLTAMRLIGTGQAHLEVGLASNGDLLMRAALVSDATGHLAVNTVLTSSAREKLYAWLDVDSDD